MSVLSTFESLTKGLSTGVDLYASGVKTKAEYDLIREFGTSDPVAVARIREERRAAAQQAAIAKATAEAEKQRRIELAREQAERKAKENREERLATISTLGNLFAQSSSGSVPIVAPLQSTARAQQISYSANSQEDSGSGGGIALLLGLFLLA
jgi:membrane protein involved in colicin uptake